MVGVITGRVLFFLGLLNFLLLFAYQAFATEIQIVETRKNLQLANDQKVFRDYYINAGTENGLKPNLTFQVYRKVAVNDLYQSNSNGGTVLLPVGKVKIIYSQTKLSIGRLYSLAKPADGPIVDVPAFMVGDSIDVGSVEVLETPKKVVKKKTAKERAPAAKVKETPEKPIITSPSVTVEISKSVPVEILQNQNRAPASVNSPTPIKILR